MRTTEVDGDTLFGAGGPSPLAPHAESAPEQDEVFHVLQSDRRRFVLEYLADREDPVAMRTVAEQLAAREHDTSVEALSKTQRQRVYIDLYQSQLPMLDELGFVDYDQAGGVVARRGKAAFAEPYLDVPGELEETLVAETEREWATAYAGVALLGLLVTGAVMSGLLGPASPSFRTAAVAVAGLHATLAVAFLATRR